MEDCWDLLDFQMLMIKLAIYENVIGLISLLQKDPPIIKQQLEQYAVDGAYLILWLFNIGSKYYHRTDSNMQYSKKLNSILRTLPNIRGHLYRINCANQH